MTGECHTVDVDIDDDTAVGPGLKLGFCRWVFLAPDVSGSDKRGTLNDICDTNIAHCRRTLALQQVNITRALLAFPGSCSFIQRYRLKIYFLDKMRLVSCRGCT